MSYACQGLLLLLLVLKLSEAGAAEVWAGSNLGDRPEERPLLASVAAREEEGRSSITPTQLPGLTFPHDQAGLSRVPHDQLDTTLGHTSRSLKLLPRRKQRRKDSNAAWQEAGPRQPRSRTKGSRRQRRAGPRHGDRAPWRGEGPEQQADPASELLSQAAVNNTVVLTLAGAAHEDFLWNWLHHVKALGFTNAVVGTREPAFAKQLRREGIHCMFMRSDDDVAADQAEDQGTAQDTAVRQGHMLQARLVARVLNSGYHVVYSDVDAVWLRDPSSKFARHPHLDILISSDALTRHAGQDAEASLDPFLHTLNTGFMLIRSSPRTRRLAGQWAKRVTATQGRQLADGIFTDMLLRGANQTFARGSYTHTGWQGRVRFGILQSEAFPSSRAFAGRLHAAVWGVRPYIVHMDPRLDPDLKRHMLREFGAWATDPPENYNHLPGFVTYTADIPEALLRETLEAHDADVDRRWRTAMLLLEHQRQQLRTGLVLAQALGRALVLPKLLSGFRAFSNVHPMWATDPVALPLEGLLNMTSVERDWPLHLVMGPHLDIRDYGFIERLLARPGHAQEVFDSARVEFCQLGEEAATCADAASPARVGSSVVRLKAGMNEQELGAALENLQFVRLLEFGSVVPAAAAFGRFADYADMAAFERRMKTYFPDLELMHGPWSGSWPDVPVVPLQWGARGMFKAGVQAWRGLHDSKERKSMPD